MSLSNDIKEYALYLGFTKAGITTADNFTDFEQELASRGAVYDPWRERLTAGMKPKGLFPSGKSIIVLAYDYANVAFPERLTNMIGRTYLSRCYVPLPESMAGARLQQFKDFLDRNHLNFTDDNNKIPMRRAAARAGVTNFGRNNFAYVDGVGSFVILYGFVVDQELEYDEPTMENKCPKDCRMCIDACPTKAISEPFRLNPQRCVGFNNWGRRDDNGGVSYTTVPRELRNGIGVHVHGCDICQEVCPRNRKKVKSTFPKDPFLELINERFHLSGLLLMTDEYYRNCVYPIMYNYIRDKKLFQRNAAIAIGNTKNDKYIPVLEEAFAEAEDTVRVHVAWALGEISGIRAKHILEKQWKHETSGEVKEEIALSLSRYSC